MDDHNVYLRPPIWLPIVVAILLGGFYIQGKKIEVRDQAPATIVVTGEGKMSAAPDIAQLSFGVTTGPQASAKVAMTRLTDSMSAVLAAVRKEGIAEKDITTQALSLNPQYDWNDGRQTLRGYEAMQTLLVKVRDLDKVGEVLSAATSAGANQAGGVSFIIDDPEKGRREAREKAIEQAKEKAKVLASQLGMSLGKVKGFSEGGGVMPPMPMMARAEMMGGAMDKAIEIPVGEQDVNVQVTITYELK
jgi:uncharacterized protein YggE